MHPNHLEDFKVLLHGAGWKPISFVDIFKKVTFTLWLCGCNLKCPFCHNYRLAEAHPEACRILDVKTLIDKLNASKIYIDYFLVSGGEPLLQSRELSKLLTHIKNLMDVKVGVNTNLTFPKEIRGMLEKNLIDFIATDIKAPHSELYGLPEEESERLWNSYLESLRIVSEQKILLEVRVPVLKKFDFKMFKSEVKEANDILKGSECKYYIRVNPILGQPYTIPRNSLWAQEHCTPSSKNVRLVHEILIELGLGDKIV
ncbi:MAG: anaerobic ribonucleoside-triphosphate reductase activating protein [Nitrososphaeria archaeon]